ncbi:type IV toxin-antitoxin system AbiEi family antitoxin domain-containing protein [Microterricola pindariensis]|nr:type IV toxin-antitoxin system AbiEi family antitoxin domain-containing protein [Microterricola pindariensis]
MLTPVEVAAQCRSLGGVARTAELRARGASRHCLRRAVHDGSIERLREGIYALPDIGQSRRAAILHGGVLGCVSAAQAAGLWVMPFTGLHVWLTPTGHERAHEDCQCVAHWSEAIAFRRNRAVMTVPLALEQMAFCLGREAFFVALESALFQHKISAAEIRSLRALLPQGFDDLFHLATASAESGLESLIRYRLAAHGITVRAQVVIPTVGRVDFVVDGWLIIEADGKGNHEAPGQRHRDRRRDARAAALGYDTLRFDYALIVHDWPSVEAAVLGALRARASRIVASERMRGGTRRRKGLKPTVRAVASADRPQR